MGVTPWLLLLALGSTLAQEPTSPEVEEGLALPFDVGQRATLSGVLVERGSGLPIEGAWVEIGGERAVSDALGNFSLQVEAGEITGTAGGDDHKVLDLVETLAPGEELVVRYFLEPFVYGDQIVVYGEERREEVSRKVFTIDELRRVPGSFGDPVRALQSLPGVARPTLLEGALVIRGAEGMNTGFYTDMVPIPYMFHLFVGRSVLNPEFINDVEFYAGGMPSRFGEVTQGAVNVRTLDKPPKMGVHGRASVDTSDGSVALSARITEDFSIQGAFRYSWIGGLIGLGTQAIASSQGADPAQASWLYPRYFDYNARSTLRLGRHRLVLTAFGARDAIVFHQGEQLDLVDDNPLDTDEGPPELPATYDPNAFIDSYFHRAVLRWEYDDDKLEQVTWVAGGVEQEVNLLTGLGQFSDGPQNGRMTSLSLLGRHDTRWQLTPADVVRLGAQLTFRPVEVEDFSSAALGPQYIDVTSDTQVNVGAWVEYQRQLGPLWFSPGLRGSYYRFNGEQDFEPEPRLSARLSLHPRWTATAFVGRFTQMPTADRYAQGMGNPELGIIQSWQTSLGVEGRYPSGIEVDATVYYSRLLDLVVEDQGVEVVIEEQLGPDGSEQLTAESVTVTQYNQVSGHAFGVEMLFRLRPSNGWFGWVALTLGRALRVDETGVFPSNQDQPVSLTLVAARDLPKSWGLSGRFRLTSGHPYTPLYGAYAASYDAWVGLEGERNAGRLPVFHSLDLRIDKTWTALRARWTLYLDVYNVYNSKNPVLAMYDYDYSEPVTVMWVPVLPSLGVEASF